MKLVYYDMFIEMLLVDVELYIYSVFDNTISPRIYIYGDSIMYRWINEKSILCFLLFSYPFKFCGLGREDVRTYVDNKGEP